jgi:RNA polymerase sigma-70 factor, ECF subfamily
LTKWMSWFGAIGNLAAQVARGPLPLSACGAIGIPGVLHTFLRSGIEDGAAVGDAGEPNLLPVVEDVLRGNRDAFEEIVFLYRNQVYAAAWQLTRNSDDAMDVTQEVFIRAYRSLSSFKGNAKFSTWLHRIALNTSIDYIRRRKRHIQGKVDHEAVNDEGQPMEVPEAVVPESQRQAVYARELQCHVREALEHLSLKQRQVFLLRYYNDLSLKEVAADLRCSEGAVKRHLYRAQVRLKELLKDVKLP